jgi:hypothetical protein
VCVLIASIKFGVEAGADAVNMAASFVPVDSSTDRQQAPNEVSCVSGSGESEFRHGQRSPTNSCVLAVRGMLPWILNRAMIRPEPRSLEVVGGPNHACCPLRPHSSPRHLAPLRTKLHAGPRG